MLWATERNFYDLQTRSCSLAIARDILRHQTEKVNLISVLHGTKIKCVKIAAICSYEPDHTTDWDGWAMA